MAHVLVVEDSPDQARVISGLIETAGHTARLAADGVDALKAIDERLPDLIVTDLVMPELNGLQLVERVAAKHPALPIILMTAYGSVEIAMEALRKGAASYVPKNVVAREIVPTVENLLEMVRARKERERLLNSLVECRSRFVLENDISLIPPLIAYLEETIGSRRQGVDENELMRVGIALREALLNAMHHGNLGVGSEMREHSSRDYHQLIEERLADPRYRDRRVHLSATLHDSELSLVVRDEGEGFDLSMVPDPTSSENLLRCSGRGLYLIGTFMDEVRHNEVGNEISMLKRLEPMREPVTAGHGHER